MIQLWLLSGGNWRPNRNLKLERVPWGQNVARQGHLHDPTLVARWWKLANGFLIDSLLLR
jgi:hypothetical protein